MTLCYEVVHEGPDFVVAMASDHGADHSLDFMLGPGSGTGRERDRGRESAGLDPRVD
jgi:hypothetical protein